MNRLLKIGGVTAAGLTIFYSGYLVGRTPTSIEEQQRLFNKQYTTDLYTVAQKYGTLYSLCEQKYQLGIKGDFDEAFIKKGEMAQVQTQVKTILRKYGIFDPAL